MYNLSIVEMFLNYVMLHTILLFAFSCVNNVYLTFRKDNISPNSPLIYRLSSRDIRYCTQCNYTKRRKTIKFYFASASFYFVSKNIHLFYLIYHDCDHQEYD